LILKQVPTYIKAERERKIKRVETERETKRKLNAKLVQKK